MACSCIRHYISFKVTKFTVQYSSDNIDFADIDNGAEFIGNVAQDQIVDNYFETPVEARYIRITVKEWAHHISMRAAVLSSSDAECLGMLFLDESPPSLPCNSLIICASEVFC